MLVDKIYNRMYGQPYSAHSFYLDAMTYGVHYVSRAMDYGREANVERALIQYILRNDYSTNLIDFIRSVMWLEDDA